MTAKRQITQYRGIITTTIEKELSITTKRPIKVSILATPDTSPSVLLGLYDVLSSVGVGWEIFVSGIDPAPQFDVRIVAVENKPFNCIGSGGGAVISPNASTQEADDSDIAILASFVPKDMVSLRNHDQREIDWILKSYDRGAVLASMCTSTALLAEAGVLDGLEATTFWVSRDLVRIRYPKVKWRVDNNLCIAGNDNQILTAGGATVWQELALYIVSRFCGAEQAANAAKLWVIPHREMSQAPFSVVTQIALHNDSIIKNCQEWAANNLTHSNPVAGMTLQAGLAPTTFARRFKRATSYSPMDYFHRLRIEKAKKMLEISNATIESIGLSVGYEDPASFRRIFKRQIGITPSKYRHQFGLSTYELA